VKSNTPTLADLVRLDTIELDLRAGDKWGAIDELAGLLELEGKLIDKVSYLQAVGERENQVSTSVGLGIAIPHGKSQAVKETSVAIGRSITGIQWDPESPDICHLIILLAVSDREADKTYMQLLAILARSLLDDGFREGLMTAPNREALVEQLAQIGLNDRR
jgi:mannitol/fructose-specific phosphotransferase system IIA component (Ntr-type)